MTERRLETGIEEAKAKRKAFDVELKNLEVQYDEFERLYNEVIGYDYSKVLDKAQEDNIKKLEKLYKLFDDYYTRLKTEAEKIPPTISIIELYEKIAKPQHKMMIYVNRYDDFISEKKIAEVNKLSKLPLVPFRKGTLMHTISSITARKKTDATVAQESAVSARLAQTQARPVARTEGTHDRSRTMAAREDTSMPPARPTVTLPPPHAATFVVRPDLPFANRSPRELASAAVRGGAALAPNTLPTVRTDETVIIAQIQALYAEITSSAIMLNTPIYLDNYAGLSASDSKKLMDNITKLKEFYALVENNRELLQRMSVPVQPDQNLRSISMAILTFAERTGPDSASVLVEKYDLAVAIQQARKLLPEYDKAVARYEKQRKTFESTGANVDKEELDISRVAVYDVAMQLKGLVSAKQLSRAAELKLLTVEVLTLQTYYGRAKGWVQLEQKLLVDQTRRTHPELAATPIPKESWRSSISNRFTVLNRGGSIDPIAKLQKDYNALKQKVEQYNEAYEKALLRQNKKDAMILHDKLLHLSTEFDAIKKRAEAFLLDKPQYTAALQRTGGAVVYKDAVESFLTNKNEEYQALLKTVPKKPSMLGKMYNTSVGEFLAQMVLYRSDVEKIQRLERKFLNLSALVDRIEFLISKRQRLTDKLLTVNADQSINQSGERRRIQQKIDAVSKEFDEKIKDFNSRYPKAKNLCGQLSAEDQAVAYDKFGALIQKVDSAYTSRLTLRYIGATRPSEPPPNNLTIT